MSSNYMLAIPRRGIIYRIFWLFKLSQTAFEIVYLYMVVLL